MSFNGPRLRELRESAGLTLEELAERVGVSTFTVRRWEVGETVPSVNHAALVAKALKVSLERLAG